MERPIAAAVAAPFFSGFENTGTAFAVASGPGSDLLTRIDPPLYPVKVSSNRAKKYGLRYSTNFYILNSIN